MPARSAAGTNPPPGRPGHLTVTVLDDRRPSAFRDRQGSSVVVSGGPPATPSDTPETRLAATVQALFLSRGRTLTDPLTAEAAGLSLEGALLLVDGMFVEGHLDEAPHAMLRAHLMAMMRIPDVL